MLARELNSSTFFGSIFDSFSDKAFLIINLLLLFTITPLALIPIILEVSIAIIQSIKYAKNMNVKSNLMGKAKMWIAGFTISGVYILTDLNYLNSFNNNFTNFLANNNNTLIIISLLILSLSELLTFLSYLKEYIINIKNKFATKVILNEELELKENIADMSLFQMLFNHDFYIKYKDNGNLKFIRNLAKIHKKA
jgi:phosphatidylglycerophosphate synthase